MKNIDRIELYQSKIKELRPFEGSLLDQIKDFYRIGLTYSSNALEGNTHTISETKVIIEDGLTVGGKSLVETFEVLGHAKAYDFMLTLVNKKEITKSDILTLHELFYENIDSDYAGVYRDIDLFISGSQYNVTKPDNIEKEMDEMFEWIKEKRHNYHPIEFATLLHKKFVFIHPFKDGNGRVARLIMNVALIQESYLPKVIPPILRTDYIGCLEKAHKNSTDFIQFIADRILETQKEFLRMMHIPLKSLEKDISMKME